uniref:Dual specificity protein phosphatase 26 n=1 Tax=Pipistrellus kuhlii TaxID=59472 RepID=A0A7J7ZHS5_PIPKU|nr:dual specificity phosphatase 26 [Pipistrellus kuhlii]
MSIHFQTAADFIHRALSLPGGKILVHCAVGVSRSATLVLAYLMLYHHLTLVEAIKKVKDHRGNLNVMAQGSVEMVVWRQPVKRWHGKL